MKVNFGMIEHSHETMSVDTGGGGAYFLMYPKSTILLPLLKALLYNAEIFADVLGWLVYSVLKQ